MDEYKSLNQKETPLDKAKRIRRIKKAIIIIVFALIIIPIILSIVLFLKVNSLQKQIDMLMIDKYDMTYAQMNNINKGIVHASGSSDNSNETLSKGSNSLTVKKEHNYKKGTSFQTNDDSNSMVDIKVETVSQNTKEDIKDIKDEVDEDITELKNKKVYLTFDDGPSKNTTQILDILDEYNIKATFFVVGKTDNYSKDIYRRIVDEGHSLGLHSYSHRYEIIYESLDNFQYDLYKLQEFLYDVTNYKANIYRFPGGSGNEVTIIQEGSTITGDIDSSCSLEILGSVTGDILCEGKLSVLGKVNGNCHGLEVYISAKRLEGSVEAVNNVKIGIDSVVIGNVKASSLSIAGAIKGEIDVNGPVTIDSSAVVKGNIKASSIQISDGAVIDGHCSLIYAKSDIESIFE